MAKAFDNLLRKLGTEEWTEAALDLHSSLKAEIHGPTIRSVRLLFESERRQKLFDLKAAFLEVADIDKLDEQLERYVWEVYMVNRWPQDNLNYDLINMISNQGRELLQDCPNTLLVADVLSDDLKGDQTARIRLLSIFSKVIFESTRQSAVSNAGNAGEHLVEVMLEAIGLKEGEHYKSQHKSTSGSDTDFVFPYVGDFRDQDVEIFLAVQFSTNDRLRMVSGELKPGANAFALTASGMRAASKGLDGIGYQILKSLQDKNQQLICYKRALERHIDKLSLDSQVVKKDGNLTKNALIALAKLEYFENFALSFTDFAKKVKDKYG